MTEAEWAEGAGVPLMALGTALLRNRRRIGLWMLIGAVVVAPLVLRRPALYTASASFAPQGVDASRSGLASLAGQFGISVPAGNQSQSTDFYLRLLRARVLLEQIVADTLVVQEMGGKAVPFLDLFEIRAQTPQRREELGVNMLLRLIETLASKLTGVVELSVATRWPSVSLTIATALVNGVNDFNQRTRQGQAAAERRFIEGRLALADSELRASEDRLEHFLKTNRDFSSSPELMFQRDRLQRALVLQQQVFTSLTQAYEDVRIREVRDTPVITVIEPPEVSTLPKPRRRLVIGLLGLMLGGFVGSLLVFSSEVMARRRRAGDAYADEFVGALAATRSDFLRPVRWLRARIRG